LKLSRMATSLCMPTNRRPCTLLYVPDFHGDWSFFDLTVLFLVIPGIRQNSPVHLFRISSMMNFSVVACVVFDPLSSGVLSDFLYCQCFARLRVLLVVCFIPPSSIVSIV
jgi:hypothetical protein